MIAKLFVKGRLWWALLASFLTVFFAYNALKISFDFSPDSIFIEHDPAYQFYEDVYLKEYAHLGVPCILAVKSLDQAKLEKYVKIAQGRLAKNPYITSVISPLTEPIFLPTQEGIKQFPATDESGHLTTTARRYFNDHPLFKGSFIGKDGTSMALVFTPRFKFQDQEGQNEAIVSIESDINELKREMADASWYVTGLPIIQHEMINLLKNDQLIFMPILALFLIILLLIMTKHPLGALYPLLVIAMALAWITGYLALLDHEINVVNNAIFILIMVIGIADAVHIYTRFIDECQKALKKSLQPNKETIVFETMAAMLVPCLLTSLTTALGFAASSAAGVNIIQQFGFDAALGVMFCFVVTMLMMPMLLSLHPLPRVRREAKRGAYGIDKVLQWSLSKSLRYAKQLSIAALVLVAICIYVGRDITANQTWIGELPPDNKAVLALDFIEENFSGVMPFYIVFSGTKEDVSSYEVAKNIQGLAEKLRAHPISPVIRSPIDAIDFILEHNPVPLSLNAIDEDTYQELNLAMSQYFAAEENFDIFYSRDKKYVRILGFLANDNTQQVEQFRFDIENLINQTFLKGVSIHVTGPAFISSRALHNLTHDMAKSILLAIVYIAIFMALFFRSIRYSVVAMLPNLLPIALTIALMDLVNIDVRLATVMIFSMALGLSIDTCIHLICRVMEETNKVKGYQKLSFMRSLHHAFRGSGRPIIYTTIILLGGFSVMMFSRFVALKDFAIVSAFVLLCALISDLVLLPALLYIFRSQKSSS